MSEVQRLVEEQKLLCQLVNRAETAQEGSYADRNPMLGKMFRCPYCKVRERRGQHECRAKFKIEFIPKVVDASSIPRSK